MPGNLPAHRIFACDRELPQVVTVDDDGGTEPCIGAHKVCLRDVLKPRKTTIDYIYDFGAGWEHRHIINRRVFLSPPISAG